MANKRGGGMASHGGDRSPAGGGEADGELSRGRGRCTPAETGGKPPLPAGERRSLSRWRRAQDAGQSVAVAPTPAGRGAGKGLQPLTES